MKTKFFVGIIVILFITQVNLSCKKAETPCQGCGESNKPPLAKAGSDKLIILPTDSVSLDGFPSYDPDGTISSFRWAKISGPLFFTITNVNASQTKVKDLVAGIYEFELKVIDNKGASGTDTVTVIVETSPTGVSCQTFPINITNAVGTLTTIGSLSEAKYVPPAAAADKLVFGGGWAGSVNSKRVDIYNLTTNAWSTAELSSEGYYNMTAGNKLLFRTTIGYDVYDAVTNVWSLLPVSADIFERGPTIIAAGNRIFFAGGLISNDVASSLVDMYDLSTNTWSTASLIEARTGINIIAAGNKVFFTGGYKKWNPIDYPDDPSSKVDIYDVSTNTWSFSQLPQPAYGGYAATISGKLFFSFENIHTHTFIYDIVSNVWSTAALSQPRMFTRPIVIGNKLLLAGDNSYGSSRIDIFDAGSSSWSTTNLSRPGIVGSFATIGNKVLMLVHTGNFPGPKWEIYDASTNTLSTIELNYPVNSIPVEINSKIYMGGGMIGIANNSYQYMCRVWKLEF